MKKTYLIIVVFLVQGFSILSQEVDDNFKVEGSDISWQKIFETESNFNELVSLIKESGIFEEVEVVNNKITAILKPIDADFKGAGYSTMSAPIPVARSFFDGFVVIEYKENKYRVTLKKIILTQKYTDPLFVEGQKRTLETLALKKANQMRNSFLKSSSKILNYSFTNKFTFIVSKQDNDW